MRPGLRESIEPSGADGGNVGARPGVEPCSGGLELVELGRIGVNWGELGHDRVASKLKLAGGPSLHTASLV